MTKSFYNIEMMFQFSFLFLSRNYKVTWYYKGSKIKEVKKGSVGEK